ncbi:aldo/keto reductase [Catenulispora yoronensis]
MTLPRRRIGTLGPEVSVLSLGSWHTYDRIDFHAGVDLVRQAVEAGVNFFDVGVYSGFPITEGGPVYHGFTDVIFGRLIEKAGVKREDYVLSEKLWLEGFPQHSFAAQLDRALYRVNTHYADFAVLGDIRGETPDLRRMVLELGELVREGKLHAWGVNNWSVEHIRAVHELALAEGSPVRSWHS